MNKLNKIWLLLLLPVVVGLMVNWLTPIDIIGALWKAIKLFVGLFVVKVTFPVWGVILLMLVIPLLIGAILMMVGLRRTEESHLTYLADNFFGVSWDWKYVGGHLYDEDIVPRCPQCKTVLQPVQESAFNVVDDVTLACHHCGFKTRFDFNLHTLFDRVKREIDRKIVTGEYKAVQQSN